MKLILIFILSSSTFSKSFLPKSFQADFIQEYKSALKGKIKIVKGIIKYSYPGQIYFEKTGAKKIVFVANRKQSWYYVASSFDDIPGELTINPTGNKNPFLNFFDVLNNGLKNNKRYKVNIINSSYLLKFTRIGIEEIGLKQVRLYFSNNQKRFKNLFKLKLTFTDGKKSILKLLNLNTKVALTKENFFFKAPKNTRINRN